MTQSRADARRRPATNLERASLLFDPLVHWLEAHSATTTDSFSVSGQARIGRFVVEYRCGPIIIKKYEADRDGRRRLWRIVAIGRTLTVSVPQEDDPTRTAVLMRSEWILDGDLRLACFHKGDWDAELLALISGPDPRNLHV